MGQGSERQPSGKGQEKIGRYRLVGKLFDGALGDLWLGQSADGDGEPGVVWIRRVLLGPEVGDDAARGLVDAAREAQKLEHEGVHPVLDVVRTETEIAIISRAVEGETLRAVLWRAGIKRQPIPASIALRIGLDLIAATGALRRAKPPAGRLTAGIGADNVVIGVDGQPLLFEPIVSGFAASQEPWAKDPKLACYRAPETLKEAAKVDERADVFSAAVLLWEMLRNRPLFGGAKFEAVERSIVQGSIGRVDSLRPPGAETISKALGDTVNRALERDPITRPRTLEAFARELEKAAESIARRDGVSAFLESAAAESLSRQRALGGEEGPPSEAATLEMDVPLGEAAAKVTPSAAPDKTPPDGPGEPGEDGAGVPNFGELFGAPDAKAEPTGASPPKPPPPRRKAPAEGKPGQAPAASGEADADEEQDAGSLLEAGAEPPSEKPKSGSSALEDGAAGAPDAGGDDSEAEPAAAADAEPAKGAAEPGAPADTPAEGAGGGRTWLLLAAAAAAAIAIWIWEPWASSPTADPATSASTPAAATEAPAPTTSAAVTAEASAAPTDEASDAGGVADAAAPADADAAPEPTATVEPVAADPPKKPSGGKPAGGGKPKGRYLPGTL